MNKQMKELEYDPFTFPKHNADKFSDYIPNTDGTGFYLTNSSTLYKLDEQQGWADLDGCYYNQDGIPSGWISISKDGKQFTKYDQQMQLVRQQVNKYYENVSIGQNNQKKAALGDNGNKQSHKQKHNTNPKEFIKQLPNNQDSYGQQTSNYEVKDNVEQVHYYNKQSSTVQEQQQVKIEQQTEQQVDEKRDNGDDKSNNKKKQRDNKDKKNRKGWKDNNNENKDNKQVNDGSQQVKNIDDSYYILDITKVNDNFNLEEYNKAVLQTNNVVKQCRVEIDNKKIVVNNQKDAVKLYLWSRQAGEYNTQLELKL